MRIKPSRESYKPADAVEMIDPESSAVGYFYGTPERPGGALFSGKRNVPDEHYRYRSEASRADAWAKHCERVRSREKYQAEQREQRKAVTRKNAALDFDGQTYLSAAAVAALLRQSLKEAFPGQRFSVTSDGSLRVKWTDGPSRKQVERIAKTFEGSYFDGMIDYKGNIDHTLDGRRVSFGADFVFCERDMSRDALEQGAAALAAKYAPTNQAPASFEPVTWGDGFRVVANPDFPGACASSRYAGDVDLMGPETDDWETGRLHRAEFALELWFDLVQPVAVQTSATFARVAVLGTDGYGNTALEATDGGETGRGYPKHPEHPEAQAMRDAITQADADLAAEIANTAAFEALRRIVDEPKRVSCEVIDFAPHLAAHIARADAARRVN